MCQVRYTCIHALLTSCEDKLWLPGYQVCPLGLRHITCWWRNHTAREKIITFKIKPCNTTVDDFHDYSHFWDIDNWAMKDGPFPDQYSWFSITTKIVFIICNITVENLLLKAYLVIQSALYHASITLLCVMFYIKNIKEIIATVNQNTGSMHHICWLT